MIKIAICDDDIKILDHIKNLLNQNNDFEKQIFLFNTTFSLNTFIEEDVKGKIDILLLDIDLGGESGIELAKSIKNNYPHIKIIFVTGYINYSEDIFAADPTSFLVKPIKVEKLKNALDLALKAIENDKHQTIAVSVKGAIINIRINKIKYIESSKRIIAIYESDCIREVYIRLDELEQKLPKNFYRCHQSFIVNLDRVDKIINGSFNLNSGERIPISQSKYSISRKIFTDYLGSCLC